jgi:hypothetical protein
MGERLKSGIDGAVLHSKESLESLEERVSLEEYFPWILASITRESRDAFVQLDISIYGQDIACIHNADCTIAISTDCNTDGEFILQINGCHGIISLASFVPNFSHIPS